MVQFLADPTLSQGGNPTNETSSRQDNNNMMSREEHAQRMKELHMKRGMKRTPRRGWSLTDHQGQQDGFHQGHHFHAAAMPQGDLQTTIPENAALPPTAISSIPSGEPIQGQTTQLPRRPKMPPPRRSHSATDKEPEPTNVPRPSAHLSLLDLPSELHYTLFDFLDPIDGVCLGLAHSRLYAIHRRKNGTVSLSSRYSGPNDMEWAWRGAGPLVHSGSQKTSVASKENDLERLRVKGQMYCRKCGISRCELHRHLKEWIGEGYEYCEIKEMYGKPAGPDAKAYCFMSSPKNPHRCGRHGSKKKTIASQ